MAVEIDGKIVRSLPEQVSKNMEDNERQDDKLTELERKLDAAISGVLHYKGSVATYADLPADAEVGDVYNVIDTGANYAWTGSGWDEFGSTVDLSGYAQKAVNEVITGKYDFSNGFYIDSQSCEINPDQYGFTVESYSDPTRWLYISTNGISGNDEQDLGTSSYKFGEIFLADAINLGTSGILRYDSGISSFTSNSHFSPAVTGNYNLGDDNYRWNIVKARRIELKNPSGVGPRQLQIFDDNGYNAKIIHGGVQQFMFLGGDIFCNTLMPQTNSNSLGDSSNLWNSLYLSGAAHFINSTAQADCQISADAYGALLVGAGLRIINANGTCHPRTDNAISFGLSNYRWKNVYVSENISNGTDAVTVADLKALIDYAKAQGWIS